MDSWWRPVWRFVSRVVVIEAALCAACVGLALWRGWGAGELSTAIVVGGLALGAVGVLPLVLRTPTIRSGGSGYRGVMDMAAQDAAETLPGGVKSVMDDDLERASTAFPEGMVLIAVAALSLVVAYVVSLR